MSRRKAYSIKADVVVYAENETAAMVAFARHCAWMCRPVTVGTREDQQHRMGGTVDVDITDEQRGIGMTVSFGAKLCGWDDEK